MKRKRSALLAGLTCLLLLLCTACGQAEAAAAPQDDPNEGLGGDFHEDAVNDFTAFAGIWLGEANNDYDSIKIDADGSWALYLCGEAVDSGYLRYEPEWEAVYAYSDRDDSGSKSDRCNDNSNRDARCPCVSHGLINFFHKTAPSYFTPYCS